MITPEAQVTTGRHESRAISITTVAILGLSLPVMTLDVIPAEPFRGPNAYLVGTVLAAFVAAAQFLIVGRARRWKPLDVPFAWIPLFLVVTLLYSLFFWAPVRLGLPWIAAAVAGEPFTEQFLMRTEYAPPRYGLFGCSHVLRGGPVAEPFAPDLCITPAQHLKFRDAPVLVTLSGDRTAWGMRVKGIVAIEALEALDPR